MRVNSLRRRADGHDGAVTVAALRGDGQRLVSGSTDGTVIIWDTRDAARPSRVTQIDHDGRVHAVAWNPLATDLLATASADQTAVVWRVVDDRPPYPMARLPGFGSAVLSIVWLPDGRRLVSVTADGRAACWDGPTGEFLGEITGRGGAFASVAVGAGDRLAFLGRDRRVAVCDLSRGSWYSRAYPAGVEACGWSPGRSLLAVARSDGAVDLLTAELDLVRTAYLSDTTARSVAWADDDVVLIGSADGSVRAIDVEGRLRWRVHDEQHWPQSLAAGGRTVAVGSYGNRPHLLDAGTGAEITAVVERPAVPRALTWSADELVIGFDSGQIRAVRPEVDAGGGPLVRSLANGDGPVGALAARAGVVFAGTASGQVLRCGPDGVTSRILDAPVRSLLAGDTVLAGTSGGSVVTLDRHTLRVLGSATVHRAAVTALASLPSGTLSVATDGTAMIGAGDERSRLRADASLPATVATLGDQAIATATHDRTVDVVRLTAGRGVERGATLTFRGPDEPIRAMCLLGYPDSPVLVAAYDTALFSWPVDWAAGRSREPRAGLVTEFRYGLADVAGTGGGRFAAAGRDGAIALFRVAYGTLRPWRVLQPDVLIERDRDTRTPGNRFAHARTPAGPAAR